MVKLVAQALFHIDQVLVLEAAEVGGGFHDVFGFDHGDDAAFLGGDLSRGVALGSLIQVRVLRIAAGGGDGDVGCCFIGTLEAVGLLRTFEPCFVGSPPTMEMRWYFFFVMMSGRSRRVPCRRLRIAETGSLLRSGVGVQVEAAAKGGSQSVAVVLLDGVEAGNAREDELAAAAEAGMSWVETALMVLIA